MTRGRHALPKPSRMRRLGYLGAPLATVAVVGAGVAVGGFSATTDSRPGTDRLASSLSGSLVRQVDDARAQAVSRSASRPAARVRVTKQPPVVEEPAPLKVTATMWTTDDLDLRLAPGRHADTDGELAAGKKVDVTGQREGDYAQVVVGGEGRWVTAQYLSRTRPTDPAQMPLATGPCAGTSAVEHGLVAGADRVYEAVCHNFPQITRYGGYDNHGEHASGKAIDIMTSDVKLGTEIAEFLQAHAAQLNLYDVIWRQHIWTPVRASEGWRAMPNRGSATANHYDHVHVSVN